MDSWNSKAYARKIVESTPVVELTELDAYVFVVGTRVGEYKSTLQIDSD